MILFQLPRHPQLFTTQIRIASLLGNATTSRWKWAHIHICSGVGQELQLLSWVAGWPFHSPFETMSFILLIITVPSCAEWPRKVKVYPNEQTNVLAWHDKRDIVGMICCVDVLLNMLCRVSAGRKPAKIWNQSPHYQATLPLMPLANASQQTTSVSFDPLLSFAS